MKAPKMTLYGVSVCPTGEENYERYKDFRGNGFSNTIIGIQMANFSIVLPTSKGADKSG